MSWYTKTSSIRNDKKKQALQLIEQLRLISEGAMIDGGSNMKEIEKILQKLRPRGRGVLLIRPSIADSVIELLEQAKSIKKDSPKDFISIIDDAMSFLACEV